MSFLPSGYRLKRGAPAPGTLWVGWAGSGLWHAANPPWLSSSQPAPGVAALI